MKPETQILLSSRREDGADVARFRYGSLSFQIPFAVRNTDFVDPGVDVRLKS